MRVLFGMGAAALACLALAGALGGGDPFGRLALNFGMERLAGSLIANDGWRGMAAYRSRDFEEAAQSFARAEGGDFNAGVALARAGKFAAALEAFDRARARHPQDKEAEANFDLIASIYAGLQVDPDAFVDWSGDRKGVQGAAPEGEGSARAASTGDETTNTGPNIGLPELIGIRRVAVRKVFDDRFMLANDRWLRTLQDVPGVYLAARIAEEQKRRKAAGLLPPEPEDPR